MTKRQARKQSHRMIVKEGKTHQEVFDELSKDQQIAISDLAEIVSKVATKAKLEQYKTLKVFFLSGLIIISLLRIISVVVLFENVNAALIMAAVVVSLIVPSIGIYGILKLNTDSLRSCGVLLAISVFQSFRHTSFEGNPIEIIILGIVAATIFLALFLSFKLKTPYEVKKVTIKRDEDTISTNRYVFETPTISSNSDLLDDFVK